nr:uncharacterized protein LOC104846173 [Loxodonta africana]
MPTKHKFQIVLQGGKDQVAENFTQRSPNTPKTRDQRREDVSPLLKWQKCFSFLEREQRLLLETDQIGRCCPTLACIRITRLLDPPPSSRFSESGAFEGGAPRREAPGACPAGGGALAPELARQQGLCAGPGRRSFDHRPQGRALRLLRARLQPVHQLRILPLLRLSRVGLSKCRFIISAIVLSQPVGEGPAVSWGFGDLVCEVFTREVVEETRWSQQRSTWGSRKEEQLWTTLYRRLLCKWERDRAVTTERQFPERTFGMGEAWTYGERMARSS